MTTRTHGTRRVVIAAGAGCLAAVVFASSALAETASEHFTFGQNGTWTVPDRVTEIEVEVAGGGGGGGSKSGGNGALVRSAIEVSGGTAFNVGIGGGGEADRSRPRSGGGGASILESGDVLIIAGGGGGATNWADATGGSAGRWLNGDGLSGGPSGSGGIRANAGTGGTLSGAANGEDYNPDNGLFGQGGQTGRAAQVGGAGGEARSDSPGGGGGAGFGGGSSGREAISNLRGGGGAGGSVARGTGVEKVDGESSYYSMNGGAGGASWTSGGDGWVTITWVIPEPLPDPDPEPDNPSTESGAVLAEPAPRSVSLAVPVGMACRPHQAEASGPWMRLPTSGECQRNGIALNETGGDLYGWATTPDFPVAIAKRQVDNGWGAYELTDSTGRITSVFIPAGGSAEITADTRLFPIFDA